MNGILEITRKELAILILDRRALVVLLLFPLVFIYIIGLSTGQLLSGDNEKQKVKLGIVNRDGSQLSQDFATDIGAEKTFITSTFDDIDYARAALSNSEIRMLLVIGQRFQQQVDQVKLGDLVQPNEGILVNGLKSLDVQVEGRPSLDRMMPLVRNNVFGLALQSIGPYVVKRDPQANRYLKIKEKRDARRGADGDDANDAVDLAIQEEAEEEGSSRVYQEIVPGYTVLFVFFMVNIMARSFIQERELGTFRRLLLSPINSWSLFIGKTVPYVLLSFMQTVILFVAGKLLFDMQWGAQPLLLVPVMLLTALAATGLGLLVASLVRSDSQVSAYATFLVMTTGAISGCIMPRDWLPEVLQQVSLITPQAWALIAFDQLLNVESPRIDKVWQCCGMLFLFGAGFIAAGTMFFKPEE